MQMIRPVREDGGDNTGARGPGFEKCRQPERREEPGKEAEKEGWERDQMTSGTDGSAASNAIEGSCKKGMWATRVSLGFQ